MTVIPAPGWARTEGDAAAAATADCSTTAGRRSRAPVLTAPVLSVVPAPVVAWPTVVPVRSVAGPVSPAVAVTGDGSGPGRCSGAGRGRGATAAANGDTPPVISAVETAAPIAMLCSGCGSATTGRSNSVDSSWLTSGIRDDPPASRIGVELLRRDPGRAAAPGASAATVSASAGPIIASNSERFSRTRVCSRGSATGIITSVSKDSASLASTQSRRSRASAATTSGSSGSSRPGVAERAEDVPEDRLVEVDPAELLDALRLAEQLEAVRRRGAAPPRRRCRRPGRRRRRSRRARSARAVACCSAAASGSVRSRTGPAVGQPDRLVEQLPLVRPPVRRVASPSRGGRPVLQPGDRVAARAAAAGRSARAPRTARRRPGSAPGRRCAA